MDLNKPIWQLTAGEFLEIIHSTEQTRTIVKDTTNKQFVYGIDGIAALFGCSRSTACNIKASGKIDKAITQTGRKIIVDSEMALKLAK